MQKGDYKNSYVYKTIMPHAGNKEDLGRSYAVRLLIHYIGDIHQPLHASNRVDSDFPSGDRGGNEFPLKNHYSSNNLHAVWDSAIYKYHESIKLVSYLLNIFRILHKIMSPPTHYSLNIFENVY